MLQVSNAAYRLQVTSGFREQVLFYEMREIVDITHPGWAPGPAATVSLQYRREQWLGMLEEAWEYVRSDSSGCWPHIQVRLLVQLQTRVCQAGTLSSKSVIFTEHDGQIGPGLSCQRAAGIEDSIGSSLDCLAHRQQPGTTHFTCPGIMGIMKIDS